jgi:hypothetical protein
MSGLQECYLAISEKAMDYHREQKTVPRVIDLLDNVFFRLRSEFRETLNVLSECL